MSAETLSVVIDSEVMRQLEQLARESGVDVSRFVGRYLEAIANLHTSFRDRKELPPNTRGALGMLRGVPERPYKELLDEAIWEKHGKQG